MFAKYESCANAFHTMLNVQDGNFKTQVMVKNSNIMLSNKIKPAFMRPFHKMLSCCHFVPQVTVSTFQPSLRIAFSGICVPVHIGQN